MIEKQTIYELKPMFDTRLSFYQKALVVVEPNKKTLLSYTTPVVTIVYKKNKAIITLDKDLSEKLIFSTTTLRHIKEFLKQETGISYSIDDLRKMR